MSILVDAPEAAALVDAGATVLDTRGWMDFLAGHVPGATRVSWRIGVEGGLRSGRLGDPDRVASLFADLGVGEAPVLVVGGWTEGWGEEGRIAWDLAYLGHPDVHVLRGGYDAWSGPVVRGSTRPEPGSFQAHPREELRANRAEIEGGGWLIVDVREPDEYGGSTKFAVARGGHIPGAVNRPWRGILAAAALDPAMPIVTYCTGGVRSAMAWVALTDLGYRVAHYDGSWWEWSGSG